jgi:hypothetical protein
VQRLTFLLLFSLRFMSLVCCSHTVAALIFTVIQCGVVFSSATAVENIALAFRWVLPLLVGKECPLHCVTFLLLVSPHFMSLG